MAGDFIRQRNGVPDLDCVLWGLCQWWWHRLAATISVGQRRRGNGAGGDQGLDFLVAGAAAAGEKFPGYRYTGGHAGDVLARDSTWPNAAQHAPDPANAATRLTLGGPKPVIRLLTFCRAVFNLPTWTHCMRRGASNTFWRPSPSSTKACSRPSPNPQMTWEISSSRGIAPVMRCSIVFLTWAGI